MTEAPAPSEIIDPTRVRYIKLGEGGDWEKECLEKRIIRIGFGSAQTERFELCQAGRWMEVFLSFVAEGKGKGTATRSMNELRLFFEDVGSILWITFIGGRLWWGLVDGTRATTPHSDRDGVSRPIRDGWRSTDLHGEQLTKDRLSGALTKLAAYQGTSCNVDVSAYVIRRINGQKTLEIERALAASKEMQASVLGLMRLLGWPDFEILVDLVFTTSGWRRIGTVGKTQKTVDFDMVLPSTGERAFVQVKSQTTTAELAKYVSEFHEGLYAKMFYVFHSGEAETTEQGVIVIGPEQLAERVMEAGLVGWLIQKVS